MAGEDDDAVFLAGVFDDVVVHRLEAEGSAGGEGIGFEIALGGFGGEVLLNEFFGLQMTGRSVESFGGHLEEFRREVVSGLTVEVGGS